MNSNSILYLGISLLVISFLSTFIATFKKRNLNRKLELMDRLFGALDLARLEEKSVEKKPGLFDKLEVFLGDTYSDKLREKLSKAGQIGDEYVSAIAKRKFYFLILGLAVGFMYFASSGGYFKAILTGIFGFFLPDILLTNTIQKRSELIEGALPDAVEMLTMCVEAGLTFQQSLGKVSKNQNTVISNEFARVMSEIQIGESRSDALEAMAVRLNHPDVKKFVSAMHQVDRLGIPISTVLKEQVKELRSKSRDRAKEQAQKVPVKILGPVMACFLPSVLIIVLGPVVLQTITAFK